MSSSSRHIYIELLSEKIGFPFKEEEVSPEIRRRIGEAAERYAELQKFSEQRISHQKNKQNMMKKSKQSFVKSIIFLIISIRLYQMANSSTEWNNLYWIILLCIGFSCLHGFIQGFSLRGQSNDEKRKEEKCYYLAQNRGPAVQKHTEELTDLIYKQLSSIYKGRIQPTIRHVVVDFSKIIQAARGKGLILDAVECPHYNGAVTLPKTGEIFDCQYCGKTIKATDIFDNLKDVLGSI